MALVSVKATVASAATGVGARSKSAVIEGVLRLVTRGVPQALDTPSVLVTTRYHWLVRLV